MYNLANFFKASILSIFNFPLKEFVVDEETTGNSERGNIAVKVVFNKLVLDDFQRRYDILLKFQTFFVTIDNVKR